MQTIEAVFSLMFFLSISGAVLTAAEPKPLDDSLYHMQLANDAWRVLYLRDGFQGLGNDSRYILEKDLVSLGNQSGMCYFIHGIEMTNCRGREISDFYLKSRRTVVYDGRIRTVTFSIGK